MNLVTIDIGGTHARFATARIEGGEIVLGNAVTLRTQDYASFQTAWEAFARQQGGTLPRSAAIAVAGPIGAEVIRFTNNPWIIRPALIGEKLGVDAWTLINDFGAVGHAVARGGSEHFFHLNGADARQADDPSATACSGPLPPLRWSIVSDQLRNRTSDAHGLRENGSQWTDTTANQSHVCEHSPPDWRKGPQFCTLSMSAR